MLEIRAVDFTNKTQTTELLSLLNAYAYFGFKPYQLNPTLGTAEFWEFKL